jgi:hypothetical protein
MNQPTQKQLGGKRNGAGRPKGIKSIKTLEREAVLSQIRQRVMKVSDNLISSQLALARGLSFLYVIETITVGNKKQRQKPERVTDEDIIASYLNGDLDNEEDEYYYITTEEPSNQAIDSMLDRTFGKSTQAIELSGGIKIEKLEEIQASTQKILNKNKNGGN